MARYLYIWDNDIDIPFFKLFKINQDPHTIIYSVFNRDGPDSPHKDLLLEGSSRAQRRIFYSGECIMDETHADVVIGFFAPSAITQSGSVFVRRDVLTGASELVHTGAVGAYVANRLYIQLRLQELDYITELFADYIQRESAPGIPRLLVHDDLYKIRPYSDLNKQWLEASSTQTKTKFCCFIVSNGGCQMRNKFFEMLSKYKKVESLGRFMRNVPDTIVLPDRVKERAEYLRVIGQYKFMITFENNSLPHYTTEKIYNAFSAGTVPIYWGDPHVTEHYNPAAFVHIPTHPTFGDQLSAFITAIKRIEYLDTHPDEYDKVRSAIPCPTSGAMDTNVQNAVGQIMGLASSS